MRGQPTLTIARPALNCRRSGRHPVRSPWAFAVAVALMVGLALRRVKRVEVIGQSMAPELAPGDRLLVLRVPKLWRIRPGTLVAFPDPRPLGSPRMLVKRVTSVGPVGVDVRGDDPAHSTDSRTFGAVPRGSIVGVAMYRYGPPGRTGRLSHFAGTATPGAVAPGPAPPKAQQRGDRSQPESGTAPGEGYARSDGL